jgi:flavin-dependent dehydrogenase
MVEENERIACHPWLSWHKITGEKISGPAPLFDPAEKKDGAQPNGEEAPRTIYRHSRPKFHKMLANQAEKQGVHVEYGSRVVEYYEEPEAGKAGVVLENGEKIEADVVFAADGIGSKSSAVTIGRMVPARSTGFAIYRAAFPVELADADPMVRERFKPLDDGTPVAELWMG